MESGISFPPSNFTICDADCVARRSQLKLKLHGTELILIGDLTGRLSDGWVWDYTAAPPTI